MDDGQVVNSVSGFWDQDSEIRPQHKIDSIAGSLKNTQSHVAEVEAFSHMVLRIEEVSEHKSVARISLIHRQEAEKGKGQDMCLPLT